MEQELNFKIRVEFKLEKLEEQNGETVLVDTVVSERFFSPEEFRKEINHAND